MTPAIATSPEEPGIDDRGTHRATINVHGFAALAVEGSGPTMLEASMTKRLESQPPRARFAPRRTIPAGFESIE